VSSKITVVREIGDSSRGCAILMAICVQPEWLVTCVTS
jgi:hypothetical protein